MNQLWNVPVVLAGFGFLFRHELFRLAERIKRAHSAPAAAVPRSLPSPTTGGGSTVKEETPMDHKGSVAALLGSAAGAAEAMTDCGIDCDDTELVTGFIAAMDSCRAMYLEVAGRVVARDKAVEATDAANSAMQISPAWTNPWFLWRLASAFKGMASKDVLEAAREVVVMLESADDTQPQNPALNRAVAKLAAALPKEG